MARRRNLAASAAPSLAKPLSSKRRNTPTLGRDDRNSLETIQANVDALVGLLEHASPVVRVRAAAELLRLGRPA